MGMRPWGYMQEEVRKEEKEEEEKEEQVGLSFEI